MSIDRSADLKWQRHLVIGDGGRIFVRPIAQNDGLMIRDLLAHVSREDLRLRFFDSIKEFSPQFIAGLIDIDGLYVTALVAIDEASSEMLGVVWLHADALRKTGECAILLRSDFKGRGLGWDLMQLMIEYARSEPHRRPDPPGELRDAENVSGSTASSLHWSMELLATIDWLIQNDGVAADRESIKTALKTWTGGETLAARKLKLFEDRLVDLALERLATFN